MATVIWVNIGSGNGLLPDGTMPLPEPTLTTSSLRYSDIHLRAISQEMPQPPITKICLKITCLKMSFEFPWGQWVNKINRPIDYDGVRYWHPVWSYIILLNKGELWGNSFQWRHNGRDDVSNNHPSSRLFIQPFIQAQMKENVKAPRHWPLCGKFTGDWWIPHTKCQ